MSKISTTIEQSKELLRLGLPAESADMFWVQRHKGSDNDWRVEVEPPGACFDFWPAWSLSALLEVMCYCHNVDVEFRKDKNLGWVCHWKFYDFDNKKRLDLSKCGETKIDAAFEVLITLLKQGLIKKGDNYD